MYHTRQSLLALPVGSKLYYQQLVMRTKKGLCTEKEQILGLLLMVDFEKAFDSVRGLSYKKHDRFNFGPCPDIKRWTKNFYTSATSCVSVNGQYSKWFNVPRGVRQGDPCSPYIYLISAEI